MKSIKLHKPLLETVQQGLQRIFEEGSYADKEVQKILRSSKQFGSKDRSFIAETIYDIVRWKKNYEDINRRLNLGTACKQLVFTSLMKRNIAPQNPELLGVELNAIDTDHFMPPSKSDGRLSFPAWLDQRCEEELGSVWNDMAAALNIPANVYIRANTLKLSAAKLLKLLEDSGVGAERVINIDHTLPATKDCIRILLKNNLKNSEFYKQGLFEFQDIGSQVIGEFCAVQSGDTVLDLCAGAGGKTLHLSALMNNKGKIYATDFNSERLERLKWRAQQAGCRNIHILPFEEVKRLKNLDVLVIDAPCSGLGTIKRHPDIKWKLKEEDIKRCISIQHELLELHRHLIHRSGKIIYATCSMLPSESEQQVKELIHKYPEHQLNRALRTHPHLHSCDGFYMAEISKR
jgi:16S rRNA (cytosine967-C5)-methyltransferase